MLSTDTEMPDHVEEAYRLWLDAAGRNVYEVARILGGRRQTYQEWASKWRWKDRAELEDVEGRDRAVRTAYYRMANAASAFVDSMILAARCRVDADGVHYALTDDGKRVDCPAPVAVRAASAGLQTLGISPVKAVTLAVEHHTTAGYTDAEFDAMLAKALASNDTATLLALQSGRPLPDPTSAATVPPGHSPLPTDFTSDQPGGRGVPGPMSPETEHSRFPGPVLDAAFTSHPNGDDDEDVLQG